MTVSTFLAGFSFAALFQLLQDPSTCLSAPQRVSAFSLIASLALFVASIYMYDRLSMPEGFWVFGDRPPRCRIWRPGANTFKKDRKYNGPLYAHMVWTWTYVFTPAILLALAGFLIFMFDSKDFLIIIGACITIAVVIVYFLLIRQKLVTD
jgi:hypothetical protein